MTFLKNQVFKRGFYFTPTQSLNSSILESPPVISVVTVKSASQVSWSPFVPFTLYPPVSLIFYFYLHPIVSVEMGLAVSLFPRLL